MNNKVITTMKVNNNDIRILKVDNEDYISLIDLAKYKNNNNPADVVIKKRICLTMTKMYFFNKVLIFFKW